MKGSALRNADWWSPETQPRSERLTGPGSFHEESESQDGRWSALLALAAGGALLGYGVIRRDRAGLLSALGGSALMFQGTRLARESDALAPEQHLQSSIIIGKSPQQINEFWSRPQDLARIMPHVESIREIGPNRQHWTVSGPFGKKIAWDAEIISNVPNRLLSWQTLPGSDFEEWGSVEFNPLNNDETEVTLTMNYRVPGGVLGSAAASLLGREPSQAGRDSLRRLKQLLETGEIATVDGQPAGKRSRKGKAFEAFVAQYSREPEARAFTRRRA